MLALLIYKIMTEKLIEIIENILANYGTNTSEYQYGNTTLYEFLENLK
jgi:hypothetical protein